MMQDDSTSGQDLAARQGARTLQEAQLRCAEAIYYLDMHLRGDPTLAIVGSEVPEDSPIMTIHSSLLHYFRQFEPHLIVRAEGHYTGDALDEPIATVKIPQGPEVEGMRQTTEETIDGIEDLSDWSMRSIELPGFGRKTSPLYLSPDAIVASYRQMLQAQAALGLHVRARKEVPGSVGGNSQPSRI